MAAHWQPYRNINKEMQRLIFLQGQKLWNQTHTSFKKQFCIKLADSWKMETFFSDTALA